MKSESDMLDFKTKRLSEISELLNGYAFKSSKYVADGIRVIRIANVKDGYIADDSPCFYPVDSDEDINKYRLFEGDMLISLTGNVGRVGIVPKAMLPAALNQRVCCIRLKDSDVSIQYLFYYFLRKEFIRECTDASKGVAQLNLSTKWLENYSIPVPSYAEQERIVARIEELFSELDNGVETLRKTKEQLAVYRQAVLNNAFQSVVEKRPIREMSSIVTSGSRGWAKFYDDNGARFIRITDLTRNKICLKNNDIQCVLLPENAEGKRSRLMANDVLVSITADLGSIALVPDAIGEAYINQHIAMIRFNNPMQGKYMAWYLKSDLGQKDLLKNKRGGGKLGLGLDDIRDTPVPIVSDDVAKCTIAYIDSQMSVCDSIEQTVDVALQQAEAMRQSILRTAFEGGLSNV